MYKPISEGTEVDIQGLKCWIPKKGWLKNPFTDEWEHIGIHKRSTVQSYCYWEPDARFKKIEEWRKEEANRKKKDPNYIHADLEEFKRYCWYHRLAGFWFSNNGEATYITGKHWFYLSCYHLDIGLPKYRDIDREFFYAWDYCEEDPESFGICATMKRRGGKTYMGGCLAVEMTTRNANFNSGIQSKTETDAKGVYRKAIINPFRKLPYFFQPTANFGLNGKAPQNGLSFTTGKMSIEDDELASIIDFRASNTIAYDGYKLCYYMGDEEGKTVEVNVYDRWNVVKYCLMDDEGKVIGKSLHTTTVEEMEEGGQAYFDLWKDSNQNEKTGRRTPSGLYRFFVAADRTRYIDKYGKADVKRAREAILEERSMITDPRALSSAKRKEPLDEHEAFQVDASQCRFNPIVLNERLDLLKWGKIPLRRGNFHWKNDIRHGEVMWADSPTGRFLMTWEPPEEWRNRVVVSGGEYEPAAYEICDGGIDPYDHLIVSKEHERRMSNGALCIVKRPSSMVESDVDEGPVLLYISRPSPDVFYEDCVMALRYYGCQAMVEDNRPGLINYMTAHGYSKFIYWIKGRNKPGISASTKTNDDIASITDSYITNHINTCNYIELIEDWLKFDPRDTTEYDAAMAFGYAKMLQQMRKMKNESQQRQVEAQSARIEDYFSFWKPRR